MQDPALNKQNSDYIVCIYIYIYITQPCAGVFFQNGDLFHLLLSNERIRERATFREFAGVQKSQNHRNNLVLSLQIIILYIYIYISPSPACACVVFL